MAFADTLKKLMDMREMKAVDLARSTGLSEAAISGYLKGTKEPRGKQSVEIAKALNVPLDVLWETDFAPESQKISDGSVAFGDRSDWLSKLNQMKKESGKTTEEISVISGIPKGTLNKLFAGQTKDPQLGTVRAVVHCLGHTLDDLDDSYSDENKKASESDDSDSEARKQAAIQHLMAALSQAGIIDSSGNMSNRDFEFLRGIVLAIRAHFNNDGQ